MGAQCLGRDSGIIEVLRLGFGSLRAPFFEVVFGKVCGHPSFRVYLGFINRRTP